MESHSRRTARLRRGLALAVMAALGAAALQAQAPAGRNFLWKVQSGPRVLYLAGSVHALRADVYPLHPNYERAFAASGTLVEEIDLGEAGLLLAAAPSLLAKGMYRDGRTLDQALSPETMALLREQLQGLPLGAEMVRSMKPWMVMLMLSALQMQQAGLDVALGLDKYFFDKATAAGTPVIGLETAASQIDRFAAMPEPLQEQLLRRTLAELGTQQRELDAILSAWQRGDAAGLERVLLDGFKAYPAVYRSLIVERNHNWMPQLEQCLTRTRPCFVVVGAAHLVGPDGLLALLRARGYRIEQQ